MPGIFQGSTPITPHLGGTKLSAVYVGDVKVWPTGWYTKLFGTQWATVQMWSSGAAVTLPATGPHNVQTTSSATTVGKRGLSWGDTMGLAGATAFITASSSVTTWINGLQIINVSTTIPTQTSALYQQMDTGQAYVGYNMGVRQRVALERDSGWSEEVARFSFPTATAPVTVWASQGGVWTCTYESNGKYRITAPRDFESNMADAHVIRTNNANSYLVPVLDEFGINGANTVRLSTYLSYISGGSIYAPDTVTDIVITAVLK